MGMGNAYVSAKDFKRLEKKVNAIFEAHSTDSKLTKEEKKLAREAKKDLKSKKKSFIPIEQL